MAETIRAHRGEASRSIHTEYRARYRTTDGNEQYTRTGQMARVLHELGQLVLRGETKYSDAVIEQRTTKVIRSEWETKPGRDLTE